MHYKTYYTSPIGEFLLTCDKKSMTGLWFLGQKYFPYDLEKELLQKDTDVFDKAKQWLDIYFSGKEPKFSVPVSFDGTPFQNEVWKNLLKIPYGKTVTYGEIAKEIAFNRELESMSAQAVGGAVGKNKISIFVPCHRVLGTDGSLTGYAGGIINKEYLLKLEKIL